MSQQDTLTPAQMFDQQLGPALFAPGARVLLRHAQPQPGEHVLDLACATGTVARHVASVVGEQGKVVGLDINPGMLTVARAHPAPDGAPIHWQEGDATALDLPDNSFDLVLCQQGLQFFPDRAAAVQEMLRVLTEGGRVALDVWQALELHPVYEALCRAEARYLGVPLSDVATPWSLPSAEELRDLLNEVGFKRIEVIPESFDAHLASAERFVYLSLFAFNQEDEASRSAHIETVNHEVEPVMQRYRDGDGLTFPVSWHIATGYK